MTNKRNARRGAGNAPVARGNQTTKVGPKFTPRPDGGISVSNTEFLCDMLDDKSIQGYDTNPGLAVYPWLCRVAQNYESYRFTKLVYHYTPTCSSSTAGIVVMAADYDASDGAPGDKQTISSYNGSQRGNVWNKLSMSIRPRPNPIWYFVSPDQNTINPTGTDIKLYEPAKLWYGVFNGPGGGATVGELSVEYTVEFRDPATSFPLGPSAKISGSVMSGNNNSNFFLNTTTVSNADILCGGSGAAANQISFKTGGQYLLNMVFGATLTSAQTGGPYYLSDLITVSVTANGSTTTVLKADSIGTLSASQSGYLYAAYEINVPNGAIVTLAATAVGSAAGALYHYVTRVANYYNKLG